MFDIIKISAVAELTYRKMKEPAFLILFAIMGAIGYCVSEMSTLSFAGGNDILGGLIVSVHGEPVQTGVVLFFLFTALIALFMGATEIPRDIDSRMIMLVLAKPVRRYEYLIGKFFGVVVICTVFFLESVLAASTAHLLKTGELYSFFFLVRQLHLLLAFFPFVALCVLMSVLLSDLSAIIVSVVYLIFSIMFSGLIALIELLPGRVGGTSFIYLLYYCFPNFLYFFHSFRIAGMVSIALVVYSISLTVIVLVLAGYCFGRRDMI